MPSESLKEKGQTSTIIQKLRLWLEEISLRAEASHVLTTEGSLAEKVRPGVSWCSGCRAMENPGNLLQKIKITESGQRAAHKREVEAGAQHQSSSLPRQSTLCLSLIIPTIRRKT